MSWNKDKLLMRMLSCAGVAAAVLVVDQVIKYLIMQGRQASFLNGNLVIEIFYNPGIAFSIPLPQIVISLAIGVSVMFVLWLAFAELQYHRSMLAIAAGLVLGGSVGNVIDRLRFGAVIDYIHVLRTSVLNLADLAIAIGLLLIVIVIMRRKSEAKM